MKTKSQWNFGELFPTEAPRRVWTVGEITVTIRRLLEQQVGEVWVAGEITNLRAQASGHVYFTLKDPAAQLSCVLFRGEAARQRSALRDGQKMTLQGELTVYEPRGQYQLRVTAIEAQGVGALQLAFEKLKQRLDAEGLFRPERKRPLPPFPARVGVVTSPTGAALRDVEHVARRRYPGLELILAPCLVQGEGAAAAIAAAIARLNQWQAAHGGDPGRRLDAILVTRGGGSLEDLWAFNEEAVARAVFTSTLPVVSAVGHEIDFTICDFVADVRAATPSAAAEILTANVVASRDFLAAAPGRLWRRARRRRNELAEGWGRLARALERAHPRRRLNDKWQRLDEVWSRLPRHARHAWREDWNRWRQLEQRLRQIRWPQEMARRRQILEEWRRRWREQARRGYQAARSRWEAAHARLELLSPDKTLARGYSVTLDADTGRVLRAAAEVRPGQRLQTRLAQGTIRSVAEDEECR